MSRKPRIQDDVLDAVREDDIASIIAQLQERWEENEAEEWPGLSLKYDERG